jgi:hypothetical protein
VYADNNQGDGRHGIKPGVANGTYAFQDSGFVTDPSGLVLIHVAGQETFFANGTVTGRSFVLSRTFRYGLQAGHVRRHLHGQWRWQFLGDYDQLARGTGEFRCLPYAGRLYLDVR